MRFDTVIIGGGLAGMACGIRLAEAGRRCAIVSQGQSALHFSSGSFDLLGRLPDGTRVEDPIEGIAALERTEPEHPYVLLGAETCAAYARRASGLLREAGIPVAGDCRRNHFRVTPMGKTQPTWLTIDGYLTSESADRLPFGRVCIVNVEGFLDFYPEFIAEEFRRHGVECRFGCVNLPDLEQIRRNPSEMRSANIARVFDNDRNLEALAAQLCELSEGCDAVILPAIVGLNRNDAFEALKARVRVPIRLLPTLPPSIPGIKAQQSLQRRFRTLGGEYFLGDAVVSAEWEQGRVKQLFTANHGNIPFRADNFVLATGSFFSRGLVATPDRIVEPVFGADTAYAPDRSQWYTLRFFDRQNYQAFGVRTDRSLRVLREGVAVANLYCAGAGLAGFHPVQEGCGAGVSLLTALYAADQILNSPRS
ncbi:glycerol-3-phosphate dehydrogenase subunit GlpB [uncultured Alistipes sp.]|uniref:glycerol-3-phosphate dehydrogenase subunit GlpB n=1 Tax=uncultured Alistipes sp. TaxID=538949 RepID=UPI002612B69D|nr:glycerol-3-phosphate dehydrogenase subunit GlpB [uncultured Alistipes sp.]